MAKGGYTSMWKTVLQIALAVVLIIGGINAIGALNSWGAVFGTGDALVDAVGNIFKGNSTVKDIVVWAMAIIEIICGALLLLDFLHIKQLDRLDDLFLLIIMIAWIVCFVILGDIVGLIKGNLKFVPFLVSLAENAIMIAVMGIVKAKI